MLQETPRKAEENNKKDLYLPLPSEEPNREAEFEITIENKT